MGFDGPPVRRFVAERIVDVPGLLHPNPWGDLPEEPPFVLRMDRDAVATWNAKASPKVKVRTDLMPDPPLGDPLTAAVVVLALNPSLDDEDFVDHRDPELQALMRKAMTEPRDLFWLRDDVSTTTGGRWWRRKLAALIEATSLDAVRREVAVGHLHQYHSKSSSPLLRPPSGRHNLELIRKVIPRGVPMLALTGVERWRAADPAIRPAEFWEPQSAQAMVVSPRNHLGGFDVAVEALSAAIADG